MNGVMSRRVDLPSGGYLMIDYAEALTVIDVNSGSFIGRGKGARLEDTITKTNLEAAEEVVNQLRLRDIGGIIVIDFIDMARARNRDAVMKTLRKALDEDRTKTFTAEISKLGLVEMTRQNVTEGVREIISRPCPTCDGEGVILSEETIAIEFERRLRDIAAEAPRGVEAFLVQINPRVTAQFTGHNSRTLHALEADTGHVLPLRGLGGAGARPLRDHLPGHAARRSRSARCRSATATRCSCRSSSRTCTTSTTRWPRSTATSSRSPVRPATSGRSGWCASRRSAAPPPARCCSTSTARSSPRRAPRSTSARAVRARGRRPRSADARPSARAAAKPRRSARSPRRQEARTRRGRGRAVAPTRRGEAETLPAPAEAAEGVDNTLLVDALTIEDPQAEAEAAALAHLADDADRAPPATTDVGRDRRRATPMTYNLAVGAAAAEADGAVRLPRPRRGTSRASDRLESRTPRNDPCTQSLRPVASSTASSRARPCSSSGCPRPRAPASRCSRSCSAPTRRCRRRRPREGAGPGARGRAPARREAARVQVQAQARLPPPHRPPPGAHPHRGDRHQRSRARPSGPRGPRRRPGADKETDNGS